MVYHFTHTSSTPYLYWLMDFSLGENMNKMMQLAIPERLHKRMKELKRDSHVSLRGMVLLAIEEYLNKYEELKKRGL